MDRVVGDLMHHGVMTCRLDTRVEDVARFMVDNDVSALVVVNDDEHVIGLISRTDLINARLYEQYWKHWRGLTAGHIMVTDVVVVSRHDSVHVASKLMMEHRIHRVVVIEQHGGGQKPVGVLSVTDLVRDIARESS